MAPVGPCRLPTSNRWPGSETGREKILTDEVVKVSDAILASP